VVYCVNAPPIKGPKTVPICATDIRLPSSRGLFLSGTEAVMMVRAPFIKPDPPIPATALPTINMSDETETPHNRDPNSKTTKKARKVYLELK
jgi:hypothetical protein